MKIIPDRIYVRMQCGASRLADGSGRVLPFISSKIPFDALGSRWRRFVMPGIILAPLVAGFTEPRAMFVIVPLWLVLAWKHGSCPHCLRVESTGRAATSTDQDREASE